MARSRSQIIAYNRAVAAIQLQATNLERKGVLAPSYVAEWVDEQIKEVTDNLNLLAEQYD